MASTSHAQDDITPGQGSGHVTPDRGQEAVDPVDPGIEPHEDLDSDSEVNPDRFSQIDAMIARRVQAALADIDKKNDAYQQELCGQMHLQDQRMASLELQQSNLNAGECHELTLNFSPMYYMTIIY